MDKQTDSAELTADEVVVARKIFEGKDEGKSGCIHCAGIHDVVLGLPRDRQPCSRIKSAKWHADGTLLEVEYWPYGQWSDESTIYPHDVYGTDDEADDDV